MHVEEIDPRSATREKWQAYTDHAMASWLAIHPDEPPWPTEYFAVAGANFRAHRPTRTFLAHGDAGVIGAMSVQLEETPENRHRIDLEPDIAPGPHEDAAAGALLETAVAIATERGARAIGAWSVGGPMGRVLDAAGAQLAQVEQRNVLDLRTADAALLHAIAVDPPEGYRLVTWDGAPPEEWMDEYLRMLAVMNDAPRGTLDMADWKPDREKAEENARTFAARGDELWVVAAEHIESGRLAAFTEHAVIGTRPFLADQEDTAVDPVHRGHGLGRYVKAVNLIRLLDERPDVHAIQTWNADDNAHMIAVNRELGFVCASLWEARELKVG